MLLHSLALLNMLCGGRGSLLVLFWLLQSIVFKSSFVEW